MPERLKLERILIGTSLDAENDGVVRTGVALARATGATPWLLHAYSPPPFPSGLGTPDRPGIETGEPLLLAGLAEQAERTGLAGLPGFHPDHLRLARNAPTVAILDQVRQLPADLIVLGASEGRALRRVLLGATADGVIRQTPCPVLVVRSEAAFPPARVEIAVDLSLTSANALRQGKDFLSRIGARAEIEILFVLSPFEMASLLHFTPEQIDYFALNELHRLMAANGAAQDRSRLEKGHALDEILAALTRRSVDLAILGTHGRRGFDRLVLGSVATGVMYAAGCNLLIVPPEARLREDPNENRRERFVDGEWQSASDEALANPGPDDL